MDHCLKETLEKLESRASRLLPLPPQRFQKTARDTRDGSPGFRCAPWQRRDPHHINPHHIHWSLMLLGSLFLT